MDNLHLWDTATLIEHAAEESVSIMFPTAAERSSMCSSEPIVVSLDSRLPAFAAGEYDTICVSGGDLFADLWKQGLVEEEVQSPAFPVWHKAFLNSRRFAAARKWLQPTWQITNRVHYIVRTLLTSKESFYAIHVSPEDDFADACPGMGPKPFDARIEDLKCMLSMPEIAEQLQGA